MNFAQPHFAEPRWLGLAVLGPLLLLALQYYAGRARRRQLALVASPDFLATLTHSHSPVRRSVKNLLLLLALAGMGLALARPQWGVREITSQNLSEDIVFAMDCSRSMLAADVSPNRLERAKLAVQDFVRRHSSGRVGLIAFAGQAFLQCPLTFDHGAFEDALLALDEKAIMVPGTDVGRALEESCHAMEKMDRKKVIVLITDGEDLEKSGVKIATRLAATNVVIFTVGVGTEAGAEIRILNDQGQPELVRDSNGEVVQSRLDEPTLRAIAEATKGDYQPLGPLGEGLAKIRLAVENKGQLAGAAPLRKLGIDRYHVPIAIVLVLLVVESLTGTRRHRTKMLRTLVGGLVLAFVSGPAEAATNTPATTNSVPAKATPEPEPENAREFFNVGTRQLQAEKWREAEASFQSSLKLQDERFQPQALYNLGQVRYGQGADELKRSTSDTTTARRVQTALAHGDQALQQANDALAGSDVSAMVMAYMNGRGARKDLREAIDLVRRALETHGAVLLKWQRALSDFKSALELNPNDQDTKRNVEIVEEAIAKLIDKMRQMAQLAQLMGQQRQALGEAMKQLRGKIPAPDAPPGGGADEEDEDDAENPKGPREGQQEGRGPEGEEQHRLTPEEAGWLLESFKLGGDRRLPMGQGPEVKPKDRKGKNW